MPLYLVTTSLPMDGAERTAYFRSRLHKLDSDPELRRMMAESIAEATIAAAAETIADNKRRWFLSSAKREAAINFKWHYDCELRNLNSRDHVSSATACNHILRDAAPVIARIRDSKDGDAVDLAIRSRLQPQKPVRRVGRLRAIYEILKCEDF